MSTARRSTLQAGALAGALSAVLVLLAAAVAAPAGDQEPASTGQRRAQGRRRRHDRRHAGGPDVSGATASGSRPGARFQGRPVDGVSFWTNAVDTADFTASFHRNETEITNNRNPAFVREARRCCSRRTRPKTRLGAGVGVRSARGARRPLPAEPRRRGHVELSCEPRRVSKTALLHRGAQSVHVV